jgi:hypothetical protein
MPNVTYPNRFPAHEFGVVGDGSDSTVAFEQACSAAGASGGGVVELPDGVIGLSRRVTPPSDVVIDGGAMGGTTILKLQNIPTAMLDFSGSSNSDRCQRGGLRDVKLSGGDFTGPLVRCKWADHMNFSNVWFYGNADSALVAENLWDTDFTGCDFEWCSGSDGLKPSVLITSNADDSSNVLRFQGCRWESFRDGALWVASGGMGGAYTPSTGANPAYGIYVTDCKMEAHELRGPMFDASADVGAVHFKGLYVAATGLASGISTGRDLFSVIGAADMTFEKIRVLANGSGNTTVDSVFRVFTNAQGLAFRDILVDDQQALSTGIFDWAGGTPQAVVENVAYKDNSGTIHAGAGTNPLYPSVASAATVTIPRSALVVNITGTTGITSITAAEPGRRVVLRFAGILTVTDGSNLKLAGNFTTAADSTLELVCDGTNWIELGRSAN